MVKLLPTPGPASFLLPLLHQLLNKRKSTRMPTLLTPSSPPPDCWYLQSQFSGQKSQVDTPFTRGPYFKSLSCLKAWRLTMVEFCMFVLPKARDDYFQTNLVSGMNDLALFAKLWEPRKEGEGRKNEATLFFCFPCFRHFGRVYDRDKQICALWFASYFKDIWGKGGNWPGISRLQGRKIRNSSNFI